jgi:hypothetical protein
MLKLLVLFKAWYISRSAVTYLACNATYNALHSSCNTTVHLLWSTSHTMFTVTHYIQAAIPLSTCCEVSSNARTLNLCSYHIQHSTVALSKSISLLHTNVTIVRHSKLFPIELINTLFMLQPTCPLNLALVVSYVRNYLCWQNTALLALNIFNFS